MRVFLLMIVLSLSNCCSNYWDLSYSDCNFFMNYTDTSCTTFTFNKCQWSECGAWYGYYDYDGYYYERCSYYVTLTETTWSGCTNKCCEPGVVYEQTTAAVMDCQAIDKLQEQIKYYHYHHFLIKTFKIETNWRLSHFWKIFASCWKFPCQK
mgnify:CR=1 FL=1